MDFVYIPRRRESTSWYRECDYCKRIQDLEDTCSSASGYKWPSISASLAMFEMIVLIVHQSVDERLWKDLNEFEGVAIILSNMWRWTLRVYQILIFEVNRDVCLPLCRIFWPYPLLCARQVRRESELVFYSLSATTRMALHVVLSFWQIEYEVHWNFFPFAFSGGGGGGTGVSISPTFFR